MTEQHQRKLIAALEAIANELRLANELRMLELKQDYDVVKLGDIAGTARSRKHGTV